MFTDEQIEAGARAMYAFNANEAHETSGIVLGPWSAMSELSRERYRRWARAVAEGFTYPTRNFELRVADWRGDR